MGENSKKILGNLFRQHPALTHLVAKRNEELEEIQLGLIEIQKGCGKDKERPEICCFARPGARLVKAGNAGVG